MHALTEILHSSPEYRDISRLIDTKKQPFAVVGLATTPKAHLISALCDEHQKKCLIITQDEGTATRVASDLSSLGVKSAVYPAKNLDLHSGDTKSMEYERIRLGVLGQILFSDIRCVVLSVEAAMQYTIPPYELKEKTVIAKSGDEIGTKRLGDALISAGYVRAELVEGKGQFSIRGSIVDFFPPNEDNPIRIELWGDEIDSVNYFDIVSQRRLDTVDEIKITPANEILIKNDDLADKIEKLAKSLRGKSAESQRQVLYHDAQLLRAGVSLGSLDKYYSLVYDIPSTIFDYFDDCLFFVTESAAVKNKAADFNKINNEEIKELLLSNELCRSLDKFTITPAELLLEYERLGTIYIDNFSRGSYELPISSVINVRANQTPSWEGSMNTLLDDVRPDLSRGYTVVIMAGTEKNAKNLWQDLDFQGVGCCYTENIPESFIKNKVTVIPGHLSYGVEYPDLRFEIITSGRFLTKEKHELLSKKKQVRRNKDAFHSLDELTRGDYVVHNIYGIGVFDCITTQDIDGVKKDYIKIKYAGSDVLYVPVTDLDSISKYIGGSSEDGTGKRVKINKLGSPEWKKTKRKVKAAVYEYAEELTKLYAERKATVGFAFSEDIDMQSDFERRFEYEETDDQLRSIYEIKHDMMQPYPMDRLLCGDVGFGKTEVALRAAFKCICDGKQVAMLVPTTILAMQHYRTISGRFEGFPVTVDMLCRFRDKKQQTIIKKKLEDGSLDMVVGTHGLIAKSVKFKDLGLLIIDEEQRFGVLQKEKLKQMFPKVDVLTLSATPIPRTLNMAMTGIRDMSVLEQPPFDRLPVQTFVLEYNMGVLVEAMQKELRRGGQIYYLFNNVDAIYHKAREIQTLLPDARVAVGHGQMGQEELSDVWRKLVDGEIDILVCTTIIETGVDVPNVNTLIIENAHRMGLAQLHQLRGRVGRSSQRGYAYLTIPPDRSLSTVSEARLNAIREYTQFGSGFKIAARDLEIRGAGSLLGTHQHGHMATVGYNMYIQLLDEAIEEVKSGEKAPKDVKEEECLVDLKIDAHIPEGYISNTGQRMSVYRKIADIRDTENAMDVIDELIDRYGDLPDSVNGLVTVSLIRKDAIRHGIYRIGQSENRIILYFKKLEPEIMVKLSAGMKKKILVNTAIKQYISLFPDDGEDVLDFLKGVMKILDTPLNDAELNTAK